MPSPSNGPLATILHVEDNDGARLALSEVLRDAGFRVLEASTGREALRLAAQRPDLVLLDVRLPDADGFDLCQRLKADPATAAAAVLMVSGEAVSSRDKIQGLEGGA